MLSSKSHSRAKIFFHCVTIACLAMFILVFYTPTFLEQIFEPSANSLNFVYSNSHLRPNSSHDKLAEYFYLNDLMANQTDATARRIVFNGNFRDGLGYGNLLYSFISAFLVALLTDSQFVLRQKNIRLQISPPLNIFDTVVNERAGLDSSSLVSVKFYLNTFYFRGGKQSWLIDKNLNYLMDKSVVPMGYLRYFYDYVDPLFMEICTNRAYFDKLVDFGLVSAETVRSAVNVLNGRINDQAWVMQKVKRIN